jgi:hypothetical protein
VYDATSRGYGKYSSFRATWFCQECDASRRSVARTYYWAFGISGVLMLVVVILEMIRRWTS